MNTTCPQCHIKIEIDPATLAALSGKNHFNCPACQGKIAVPSRPMILASAHRGMNRNLLILGGATILVLGGLGFHLASQKSGDTNTTVQSIHNDILNNTYFTQLIASGVTTREDLESISDIRPYEDGFIGISAASLDWEQANDLALRTSSALVTAGSNDGLDAWLKKTFFNQSTSSAWVLARGDVGVLTTEGAVALKVADGARKVLVHWRPSGHTKEQTDSPPTEKDGLVAYYPFNGNADDASGNGNHAEVQGANLTDDKAGKAQSAYQFDGRSSYILAPVNINPDVMPNITMIAWVRADTDQPVQGVISHDPAGFGRTIAIDNRGGGIGWSALSGTGGVLGFEPVSVGVWDFVAVVYEQGQEMTTLFVNGRKMTKQGALPQGLKNLTIGKNPSHPEAFRGVIDEVRVYDRALSESEIQQHYQAFTEQVSPKENKPTPYAGKKLSTVVDLNTAAVLAEDNFEDPNTSGFAWAGKELYKEGRIHFDGMGRPCWGYPALQFSNFACEVIARTSGDRHFGWGICVYKTWGGAPPDEHVHGVEVLLDSEGHLSIIPCRWISAGQKDIDPVGPLPVTSFKKGEYNKLVVTYTTDRKLAVFVNDVEACAPIVLPYVINPTGLQMASIGGASAPSLLEFESFKVFSLIEKGIPQIPAEIKEPEQSAPKPAVDAWIDIQGREIQAIFLRVEAETLVINFKEKETRIPLSRLSAESRTLAIKRQSEMNP